MKFMKPKGPACEFNDEELEKDLKKNTSVYAEIAREYGHRIKLMKHTAKNEQPVSITIRIFARFAKMGDLLALHAGFFTSKAEVYRSAMYIGLMILYHLMQGEKNPECYQLYNMIIKRETMRHHKQLIDELLSELKDHTSEVARGLSEPEDLKKWADDVIDLSPKQIQRFLRQAFEDVIKGYDVPQVFGKRAKGQRIDLYEENS